MRVSAEDSATFYSAAGRRHVAAPRQ